MSTAPSPQPSALPPANDAPPSASPPQAASNDDDAETEGSAIPKPHRKPLLRLEIRDLSSPGSHAFLRLLHASDTISEAVDTVLKLLYTKLPRHCIPPTRSVTIILRSMGGVAYTTGKDFDDDHKEIHFSTDYINAIPEHRQKEEMRGVVVHEMVHCWQWNAFGTAPGGLIEGIADWVRLKANLGPPHWRRHADGDWDSGYERTGYFLEFLEKDHGADIVRRINECLRDKQYVEHELWHECCGKSIATLWEEYKESLQESPSGEDGQEGERPAELEEQAEAGAGPGEAKGDDKNVEPQDSADDTATSANKTHRGGNMHTPMRPKQLDR